LDFPGDAIGDPQLTTSDLLTRLTILASTTPCTIPRDDLLQLILLARFEPEDLVYTEVLASPDPVLVDPASVREMIRMARER
jgi:hypothetical protein